MKLFNEKLVSDLLEAGKKEFLAKGFSKASLRSIAASINVTTGAIYKYYRDKEALFEAIVKEPADILEKTYMEQQEAFADMPVENQLKEIHNVSLEGFNWMIDYIYENYDAFKLIICCSNNTKYENYIERLIDIEVKSSYHLINNMQKKHLLEQSIDDKLIHIVVTTYFYGMFEVIAHDISKNDAVLYISQLKEFYEAGWFRLLGIDK